MNYNDDQCEEDECLLDTDEGDDKCPKCKKKAFEEAGYKTDEHIEEEEKGVWKMTSHHEVVEVNKVKAEDADEAKKKLENKKDYCGEYKHTPHEEMEKVDTVTEETKVEEEKIHKRDDYWKELGALS